MAMAALSYKGWGELLSWAHKLTKLKPFPISPLVEKVC